MGARKTAAPAQHIPTATRRAIRDALRLWFKDAARSMPWRGTRDPYAIWLSEILLQQTRVEQGTPYYERFFKAFPTVQALAKAHEDRVLKLWEGLGYYSRARNLHKAAKIIAIDRDGVFPTNAAQWETLPGVGRYTAGAIASIALNERVPVLDGNVIRVLSRLFNIDASTDDTATRNHLWALASELVPDDAPGDFNQAVMELGALVCTPRNPACATCPLTKRCAARAAGVQEERPVRNAKKAVPREMWVCSVIERDGRYLVGKRPGKGLLGGLWELPAGPMRAGESHGQSLKRIAADELGLTISPGKLIATVAHAYTHLHVSMVVYRCRVVQGEALGRTHVETRWLTVSELRKLALPKINLKFLELL